MSARHRGSTIARGRNQSQKQNIQECRGNGLNRRTNEAGPYHPQGKDHNHFLPMGTPQTNKRPEMWIKPVPTRPNIKWYVVNHQLNPDTERSSQKAPTEQPRVPTEDNEVHEALPVNPPPLVPLQPTPRCNNSFAEAVRTTIQPSSSQSIMEASLLEEDEGSSDRWVMMGSLGNTQKDPSFEDNERNPYKCQIVDIGPRNPKSHL